MQKCLVPLYNFNKLHIHWQILVRLPKIKSVAIHAAVLKCVHTYRHGKASKCISAVCYYLGARNSLRSRYPTHKVTASVYATEVMDGIPHGLRTAYLNCHQYWIIKRQIKGILLYVTFVLFQKKKFPYYRIKQPHTLWTVSYTSKSCLKNLAVSMLTPIAANTIAKLSSWSSSTDLPGSFTRPAWRQIWAAIWKYTIVHLSNIETERIPVSYFPASVIPTLSASPACETALKFLGYNPVHFKLYNINTKSHTLL